ncbi:MAG: trypsin-like peptidase domain-containing protein [Acidimicrobiia bacterium]|nr:trypsin-like peptidase domain-containing protein [Acidimicrobiia bacterium]
MSESGESGPVATATGTWQAPPPTWQAPPAPPGWPPPTAPPGWQPPPPPPSPRERWALAFAIVASVAVGVLVAASVAYVLARRSVLNAQLQDPAVSASSSSVGNIVDPSVVDITTTLGFQNAKAAGTGIVLTASGEILTNHHVVAGATSLSVTDVGNGRTYSGTVVGYDAGADVALVQLADASGLRTATIGDSSRLQIGQAVVAIGNANGVGGTPSEAAGAVTALDRSIVAADQDGSSEQLMGLIQTSARLVAGDSGGPLVDAAGHVVGIDTAGSGRFSFRNPGGQGFAVPIDKAVSIAHQISAGQGSSSVHIGRSAFLGVEVEPPQASDGSGAGSGSGFRFGSSAGSGAVISGTVPGSPAEAAGLRAGNVITSVGGATITSPNDLSAVMRQHHPGDRVRVDWTDDSGGSRAAVIQLANGPVA